MMSFIGFVLLLMFKSIRPEAFNTFGWIILFLLCSIVSIYNISGCYKQDTYINITLTDGFNTLRTYGVSTSTSSIQKKQLKKPSDARSTTTSQ